MTREKRILNLALFSFLFVTVIFPAAGFWVWQEVQGRMGVKISGRYSPVLFSFSFILHGARFEWDEKVKFISGDLKVDFEPLSLLSGSLLRIRLQSQNSEIELLGEWAELEGVRRVKLDRVEAHLGLAREGLRDIYFLDVRSPSLQFHLQESEKIDRLRHFDERHAEKSRIQAGPRDFPPANESMAGSK